MRRKLIPVGLLLLLLGVGAITWPLIGLPPPRFVLKYGIPPFCEPTGRTAEIKGIKFVEIGQGCFRMGSHYLCEEGDLIGRMSAILGLDWGTPASHDSDECPPHWIDFAEPFWIAESEITNKQYEQYDAGYLRSPCSSGDQHPAVDLPWQAATQYCAWMSEQTGLCIRLPSESEWEAACRAGSQTEFCFGDDESRFSEFGWCSRNSTGSAHEVATLQPNSWGLYDLHGNALEWCADTAHRYLQGPPTDGSAWIHGGVVGPGGITYHILRGGSWQDLPAFARSSYRTIHAHWGMIVGFRPAFSVSPGREYLVSPARPRQE